MATLDDWILYSTNSLLGDGMTPDTTTYAPELKKQYMNITGINPDVEGQQEFLPGGYEKWASYGIQFPNSITSPNYFQEKGTAENLAKFGFTAPMISQRTAIERDLNASDEYNTSLGKIRAEDLAAKNALLAPYGGGNWITLNPEQARPYAEYLTLGGPLAGQTSVAPGPAEYKISASKTDEFAKALGYAPSSVPSSQEYYTNTYGTDFTKEQIDNALTGRYGEIQSAPDMGEGWKNLYHTFNKWQQEDEMFRTEMLGLQNELFPAAEAQQRAAMASGGMKAGSDQWKRNLEKIQNQRMDVEAEVAQRKSALEDTSIYKALKGQYEKMSNLPEMRGITKTRTAYQDIQKYVEATSKYTGPKYGYDSETGQQILINPGYWSDIPAHYVVESKPYEQEYTEGTATGKLLYGTGNDKSGIPTFDEFYQSQFGLAQNVGNPYTNAGISNQSETEEDKQARRAASGMAME